MHNHWNSEINAGTSRTCSFTGGLHAAAAAAATTGAAAASAPSDVIAAVRRVMAAVRRVRRMRFFAEFRQGQSRHCV